MYTLDCLEFRYDVLNIFTTLNLYILVDYFFTLEFFSEQI